MAKKWKPLSEDDAEFDRPFEAAVDRGRISDATAQRAVSARYDRDTGRVVLELRNGCTFGFPAEYGQGLSGANPDQLAAVEVWGNGSALHWEELDADLSVNALVAGVFGSESWMEDLTRAGMREAGRKGGSARGGAKAQAARLNGSKGGRPRVDPSPGATRLLRSLGAPLARTPFRVTNKADGKALAECLENRWLVPFGQIKVGSRDERVYKLSPAGRRLLKRLRAETEQESAAPAEAC